MNFISYLNMHRSRLGYVNCVLLVSDVQLDSPVALRRRLDDLIFQPVYEDSDQFKTFEELLKSGAIEELERTTMARGRRLSKRSRKGVLAEGTLRGPRVFDAADLWLLQSSMRSHVGRVPREYTNEPVELAKSLGLLSPGYALTELGHMLQLFVLEQGVLPSQPRAQPNPLLIYDDQRLRLLYLLALLRADVVFPAMLFALANSWQLHGVLRRALDNLVRGIESESRLDTIAEARDLFDLRERIKKEWAAGDVGVEKPVEKAQTVPRLEFGVDLGLLARHDNLKEPAGEEGLYRPTGALELFPQAFQGLLERPSSATLWLDNEFFKAAGQIYARELRECTDLNTRLFYFARGGGFLKRRVGFIPGRIAATIGCLFAWLDGFRIEISDLFNAVYSAPKGEWSPYIKFSGGSRLDTEFFVILDPSLETKLLNEIKSSGNE